MYLEHPLSIRIFLFWFLPPYFHQFLFFEFRKYSGYYIMNKKLKLLSTLSSLLVLFFFFISYLFTLQPIPVTDFLPFFFLKDSSYIELLEIFQWNLFMLLYLFMLFPHVLLKRISAFKAEYLCISKDGVFKYSFLYEVFSNLLLPLPVTTTISRLGYFLCFGLHLLIPACIAT